MKKSILYLLLFYSSLSFAQKDVFDQSLETANVINDALMDYMASFMAFPEYHSNTVKLYNYILDVKNLCKDQQSSKYKMSNSIMSNLKVQQYYRIIDKMQIYADAFEELLRPFYGYVSPGLSQNQMTLLDPLFRTFGWKITLLDISCRDAYFYEYELNGCKMMFVKNTLPPADYRNRIYNYIKVDFIYDYYGTGGKFHIEGGKYSMIQFQNDQNIQYYKVIKATSKRI